MSFSDWGTKAPDSLSARLPGLLSGFSVASKKLQAVLAGMALLMPITSPGCTLIFVGKVLRAPGVRIAGPVMGDDRVGRRVRDLAEDLEGERASWLGRGRHCGSTS